MDFRRGRGRGFPSYGPAHDTAEFARRQRQVQEAQRDRKVDDETAFFFQLASRLVQTGARGRRISEAQAARNEATLFAQNTGTVGIDFDKYDSIPVERSGPGADDAPVLTSFNDLEPLVPAFLYRNIALARYAVPTPVQKHSIPVAITGRDVMCCAQTGSGKTAAFLLPVIAAIAKTSTGQQFTESGAALPAAVVLAPTRELASQIHGEASKFCNRSTLRPIQIYGGASARPQLTDLAYGADIIAATPGRLIDFIDRGVVSMAHCVFLVLDEADRMLDMGFEPQIRMIVEERDMPGPMDGRQTLMFSATFPRDIQKLAADFMREYVWIGVGKVGAAVESITQRLVQVDPHDKSRPLVELLMAGPLGGLTLVFVQKKKTAGWLYHLLRGHGFNVTAIHGDRTQADRERALASFRSGENPIMIATDVAARGLDVPDISHVINYDLPSNIDDYVHRIGRTARAGNKGLATGFFVADNSKSGNMNIARQLAALLADTNQEVPEFLVRAVGGYPGGGGGGGYERSAFGGRDFRPRGAFGGGAPSFGGRGGRGASGGRGGSTFASRGGRGSGPPIPRDRTGYPAPYPQTDRTDRTGYPGTDHRYPSAPATDRTERTDRRYAGGGAGDTGGFGTWPHSLGFPAGAGGGEAGSQGGFPSGSQYPGASQYPSAGTHGGFGAAAGGASAMGTHAHASQATSLPQASPAAAAAAFAALAGSVPGDLRHGALDLSQMQSFINAAFGAAASSFAPTGATPAAAPAIMGRGVGGGDHEAAAARAPSLTAAFSPSGWPSHGAASYGFDAPGSVGHSSARTPAAAYGGFESLTGGAGAGSGTGRGFASGSQRNAAPTWGGFGGGTAGSGGGAVGGAAGFGGARSGGGARGGRGGRGGGGASSGRDYFATGGGATRADTSFGAPVRADTSFGPPTRADDASFGGRMGDDEAREEAPPLRISRPATVSAPRGQLDPHASEFVFNPARAVPAPEDPEGEW